MKLLNNTFRKMKLENIFDVNTLPDLDTVVLRALELFEKEQTPDLSSIKYMRPLVVGSGNARVVGEILFKDSDAVFADESTYKSKLASIEGIDGAVLISASGGKHSVEIAKQLQDKTIPIYLLTNTIDTPAGKFVEEKNILVFPKNREPYTYNTSTYLGMILSKTKEDPGETHNFLTTTVDELLPDTLSQYDAFFLTIPPDLIEVREMLLTKFDELFGAEISGRVFTLEQAKHAKTVVPSDKEFFLSFGMENTLFGSEKNKLHIPLPERVGYGAMIAIGYYVVGSIQKQHPPYFKENIVAYTKQASKLFGHEITPIVE